MDQGRKPSPTPHPRQRQVDRACDACRRRKTKCDGPRMPEYLCSNCRQTQKPCTYLEVSKPRGPPKAYVMGLENRMCKLEALLKQLRPEHDFTSELGPPIIPGSWNRSGTSTSERSSLPNPGTSLMSHPSQPDRGMSLIEPIIHPNYKHEEHSTEPDSDNESNLSDAASESDLVESMSGLVQKLTIRNHETDSENVNARFHGKSSPIGLVDATRKFKLMHRARNSKDNTSPQEEVPNNLAEVQPTGAPTRRIQFWLPPQWERSWEGVYLDSRESLSLLLAEFPPQDLSLDLIGLYFLHVNIQFPLLHRPTFYRQWKEKLHHTDIWFACLCISLFAVASRWSDDPRMTKKGTGTTAGEVDWGVSGWNYADTALTIHRDRRSLFCSASLFEIQSFCMIGMFLRGTTSYPTGWILDGIGIRKAQDIGAHRRKVYRNEPSVEDELWKRAFWCFVVLESLGAAVLGRTSCVDREYFDIDLPVEVDDEYWEPDDPSMAFEQPIGRPAQVSAFNQLIKLSQITASVLKSLYAVDKTKAFPGLTHPESSMERLKTALSQWVKRLPKHLVWSSKTADSPFASQATLLHLTYHFIRMLICRPFISLPSSNALHQAPGSPFTAMDICVESARSYARIAEVQIQCGLPEVPFVMHAAQLGVGVLLINVWNLKRQEKLMHRQGLEDVKPSIQRTQPLLEDINFLIHILELGETRWHFVSPILSELRQSLPWGSTGHDFCGFRPGLENPLPVYATNMSQPSSPKPPPLLHTPLPWQWHTPCDSLPSPPPHAQYPDPKQAFQGALISHSSRNEQSWGSTSDSQARPPFSHAMRHGNMAPHPVSDSPASAPPDPLMASTVFMGNSMRPLSSNMNLANVEAGYRRGQDTHVRRPSVEHIEITQSRSDTSFDHSEGFQRYHHFGRSAASIYPRHVHRNPNTGHYRWNDTGTHLHPSMEFL